MFSITFQPIWLIHSEVSNQRIIKGINGTSFFWWAVHQKPIATIKTVSSSLDLFVWLITPLLLAFTWERGGGHHWGSPQCGNIKERLQESPQSGASCHPPWWDGCMRKGCQALLARHRSSYNSTLVLLIQQIFPNGNETTWYQSIPDIQWSTKCEDSNFFWQHTNTDMKFWGATVTCLTNFTQLHWKHLLSVPGDAMSSALFISCLQRTK